MGGKSNLGTQNVPHALEPILPEQEAVSDRKFRSRPGRPADSRLPLPGTLLKREWKSQTILVEVLAEGFRYDNQHYPSLSAIAVAITGTRWNGLAFFGLTRTVGETRKERQHAAK